ncbi:MAG TPA: asparagine synthase (glutamine-hydrolyzing) [Blastocatellia bacterium]|nr:asparagine synthase (glutamine-hydrolyzing) [Blastocatellia bacterium]
MCGIAGIIGGNPTRERQARRMLAALKRRGPDGEGLESWPTATLGHRRLAIIDLSDAGRQPMLTADAEVGVTFNGEIYNFRELRDDLIARGYHFRSHTDSEVLLHGYREWGLDALVARLRGMFAFALWDNAARRLYLVRDRLGVKPLLYCHRDGQLAFASTARALRDAGFADEIDARAVAEFLHFGFVTDARSIYQGVIKVPAGAIVEFSDDQPRTRAYWQLPAVDESSSVTFAEAVEETERLLLEAVKVRLYADVSVGALLSGGIDSSLVCWAMSELGADVTAYTVSTPGDVWDEAADARATAHALKLNHRIVEVSADHAPDINELVSAYGEPFACASALGMLRVSEAVAPAAKVLLTGDGGDDVFLGYEGHKHFWMAERLAARLPDQSGKWWLALRDRLPRVGPLGRAASFIDYATGGLGGVTRARDGLQMYRRAGLLGERLRDATLDQLAIPQSITSARRLLAEFLRYDRDTRFTGEYLTKVDGATMHHSVEARSPFLDARLWEFAARLPFDVRLHGGQLKAILREIARRHLGERVARGRKRGFGIPVQRWLAGRWRERVAASFSDSLLAQEGWLRADGLRAELDKAARDGVAPNQLWYSYVLESWLRAERSDAHAATSSAPLHFQAV